MEIKVLNWNIGGAKVLEQKTMEMREKVKNEINFDLQSLISKNNPHIITLQIEKTPLTRGSYFGDRDTEPRVAIISHLIINPPSKMIQDQSIFL